MLDLARGMAAFWNGLEPSRAVHVWFSIPDASKFHAEQAAIAHPQNQRGGCEGCPHAQREEKPQEGGRTDAHAQDLGSVIQVKGQGRRGDDHDEVKEPA